MIRHFTDHAANERTFLAWIRTAIAVMAMGFLLERFDILLSLAMGSAGLAAREAIPTQGGMRLAGLILVGCGAGLMVIAAARFLRNHNAIEHPETRQKAGANTDVILAGLITVLTVVLAVYLSQSLLAS
ncbi:MAG: DUF202 domain-containing protein [Alphaproteobacteria bacterium]|nr:DUF202 domain-containing protein [Alphaproteobacteria bacterium]